MIRRALGLLACLAASASLHAQLMLWINPAHVQTYARMDPTSQLWAQFEAKESQAATASPVTAPPDTRYFQSVARTPQNPRNFVARTPVDAARADLEQALAEQPTLMDDMSKTLGSDNNQASDNLKFAPKSKEF